MRYGYVHENVRQRHGEAKVSKGSMDGRFLEQHRLDLCQYLARPCIVSGQVSGVADGQR